MKQLFNRKNKIKGSCRIWWISMYLLFLLIGGCTMNENEYSPETSEDMLPVSVRIPVTGQRGVDENRIHSLRIMICQTKGGAFFFNKKLSAGELLWEEGSNGAYTKMDLELYPGVYTILAVANGDNYDEILGKEGVTMQEIAGLSVSPAGFIPGKEIIYEEDLSPFPRSAYLKAVRIGKLTESSQPGEISLDGGVSWKEDLPLELESWFPKIDVSIRKMSANEKDRIRITSLTFAGVPEYSYLLPEYSKGISQKELIFYPEGGSGVAEYLATNNNTDVTNEDRLTVYDIHGDKQRYLRYGGADIILPEFLMEQPDREKSLVLEVVYDYESWNEESASWNPPIEDCRVTVPLESLVDDRTSYDLKRNNEYHVLLTITQTAEFEFKPYVKVVVAGWDESGNGYFHAGDRDVYLQGGWTRGEPEPLTGIVYVDMYDYVEYGFTFCRENPDESIIYWKAVLSNPVDFRFPEGEQTEGYARTGDRYTLRIEPVAASGENSSTKVYIHMDNGAGGTVQLPLDRENEYVIRQNR